MDRFQDSPQNRPPSLGLVPTDSETDETKAALSRDRILSHLETGDIGANPIVLQETDSTNDYLKRLPVAKSPHGTVAVAEYQTRGKGRHGRNWLAPPRQNLLFSLVLEGPPLPGGLVTLLGACSALEGLNESPIGIHIKWPNDLVAQGKKLGGVLCEAVAPVTDNRRYILGIGLNVNLELTGIPEDLQPRATSLRILTGRRFDRNLLLARILRRIEFRWRELLEIGPEPLVAYAQEHCETLGKPVRMKAGAETLEGVAHGLDLRGALVLSLPEGRLQSFEIGEIEETRPVW